MSCVKLKDFTWFNSYPFIYVHSHMAHAQICEYQSIVKLFSVSSVSSGYSRVIVCTCGFPAESPDTLEPSRQFDESLHCCGRSLGLSHNELEWITKAPNYLSSKRICQLQQNWWKTNILNIVCGLKGKPQQ